MSRQISSLDLSTMHEAEWQTRKQRIDKRLDVDPTDEPANALRARINRKETRT